MVKEVTGGTSPFTCPALSVPKNLLLKNICFCPITQSPVGTNYWTTLKLKTSKKSLQRFLDLHVKETIKEREKYTLETNKNINKSERKIKKFVFISSSTEPRSVYRRYTLIPLCFNGELIYLPNA